MNYYCAPMEGLTDSVYRRLHHAFFGGVDCYYMPFFSPTEHRHLTNREQRELPPAESCGFKAVPQVLTKSPEDFLWAAQVCADLGYEKINLNLGCPSGTVVAKGKGAGMLADPAALSGFLEAVFSKTPLPVSIKTRLGLSAPEEFEQLLHVFNGFPACELIIHPRVRSDYYKGPVRREWFARAAEESRIPLCCNGGLYTMRMLRKFEESWPQIGSVMIGRGLIGNPGMLSGKTDADTLEHFHDALLEEYTASFGGPRNAMFRMKEHWRYMLCLFDNSGKLGKQLQKTTDLARYKEISHEIFGSLPLREELIPDWE